MDRVKLQFSKEESVLLTDPAFILTKNRILARISELMGAISDEEVKIADLLREQLPPELFQFPPKLSRGEQYQQLPWLMLDFPRVFQEPDQLAIRQFFWWGKLFSSALLVSGRHKEMVLNSNLLQWPDLYVCVHASPWEHHFEADNAQLISSLSDEKYRSICKKEFLKLAFQLPMENWEQAPEFFLRSYSRWMQLLVRS
jgi:hypothetical protein